jgi:glutathione S-transferase
MGIIATTNPEVRNMKGLHLYHHAMSNCSQKVRLFLEEKVLEWTSHYVDLMRNEHFTPEYVAINPKAQVPTLVHDGVVVIESSDIIDYLDRTFPERPLRPSAPDDLLLMYRWLKLWDDTQIHLKTLSHYLLFRRSRVEQVRPYLDRAAAIVKNDDLITFLREYVSDQGLSKERVDKANKWVTGVLAELDARLKDYEWLAGDAFSLADIAWCVDIHRFQLMKFPMTYPALLGWYSRVEARSSFKKVVLDYEAQVLRQFTAPPRMDADGA